MRISEKRIQISFPKQRENFPEYIAKAVERELDPEEIPLRFVITESNEQSLHC